MNNKNLVPAKVSNKPVVWSLFAAGGTVTALMIPVLVLLICLAVPLGLLPAELFSYSRIESMIASPWIRLIIFFVLFLSIWHSAHRMRITVHDLGLRADGIAAIVFYSIAFLATIFLSLALI